MSGPVLHLEGVSVRRDGTLLLDGIDWRVEPGQHWVVLGPNGSGKSTLLRLAALHLHPSAGRVHILGMAVGSFDSRRHRHRIGYAAAALADSLRPGIDAADVVMTALHGALEPWWHDYDDADRSRARELLKRLGCGDRADHAFGTLSSGERQRVLLARTLMTDPDVLLLDEPTAALDLGGREELVGALAGLAADAGTPPMALVTHHVEEIPPGFTHCLMLAGGRVAASGPLEEVLTGESLSECYGLDLRLSSEDGRWTVRVVPG
ncbi:MAG: iron ABC transporter ATP-binding protein [Acidimicrobiaceae bacterium]|nr:iron ABC transporter ATP-binding protein [Acidimicrobiaceae bacterium]